MGKLGQRRAGITGILLASVMVISAVVVPAAMAARTSARRAFVDRPVLKAVGRTSALVHVRPDARLQDGLTAAKRVGLDLGTRYGAIKVFVAYGDAQAFKKLASAPAIEAIEANRKLELFTETSHTATRGQDVLDGTVTMPDGTVVDGSGVGVAVVDSGIEGTHPDFAGRIGNNVEIVCSVHTASVGFGALGGFSECRGPKTTVELDDTDTPSAGGHGTHVSGIVAGTGAASAGRYHGAAPGATLYGVGVGTAVAVENALDGLAWVLENHDQVDPPIKVVNNSWGGGHSPYDPQNGPFHKATWKLQEELIEAGVTVVFAAGNGGGNGNSATTSGECVNPTPGLICVANYNDANNGTREGTINSSSSRGKSDDPRTWPDVSAPGSAIISTCRQTLPICATGMVSSPANSYASLSGTSMAAPHVAGIVAQVLQADPTLTPAGVEELLEDTAHKFAWGTPYGQLVDPFNPDDTSSFEKGHGLVDVVAAVQAALGLSTPAPEPTTPPTPAPSPSPSTAPSPAPSPTASEAPAEETRYYFHSPTSFGQVDWWEDTASFDTAPPTFTSDSFFVDAPALIQDGEGPTDPYWTGQVDQEIESLTVDFWTKAPYDEALRSMTFEVGLTVGETTYELPPFEFANPNNFSNAPVQIVHTFTEMLDGNVIRPLSIDPAGQEVSLRIRHTATDPSGGLYTNSPAILYYDSTAHPSGFTVSGAGGGTEPSPSPSPSDTETPPPPPPNERGVYPTNPNDPGFAQQWGMTKINAPLAWQEPQATGFGINISVVDSGIDIDHPDLFGCGKVKVLPGSDVSGAAPGDVPQDDDGHGTHVNGIAAACSNNGTGVVGVAPDATLIPVRAIGGNKDLDQAMADGIRFATDNGAHVINLSIGDIPPFSHLGPDGYPLTEEAMQYARENGVVIAAAAGNFDQPTCEYPSLSRNVICVVATDPDDLRSYYSDFAVNIDRNSDEPGLEPVVSAPGGAGLDCAGGITSTYLRGEAASCSLPSGYANLDGTSMASPHVAGVAALLYDRLNGERTKANADLIVQAILDSSVDLGTPGWDPVYGHGRIDALAAVQAVEIPASSAAPVQYR